MVDKYDRKELISFYIIEAECDRQWVARNDDDTPPMDLVELKNILNAVPWSVWEKILGKKITNAYATFQTAAFSELYVVIKTSVNPSGKALWRCCTHYLCER